MNRLKFIKTLAVFNLYLKESEGGGDIIDDFGFIYGHIQEKAGYTTFNSIENALGDYLKAAFHLCLVWDDEVTE